jgi:CRISPR system Cascade subunit CasA
MPSFDLRDRPWIPVRYINGASGPPITGLAGLFLRAHEIADITVPVPPAASGLWRILYLIAARISGLDDLAALDGIRPWKQARNRALDAGRFDPAAIERYFTGHADRFDLFGSARPWLQDPRLAGQCPKNTGVNKLVMGRATGNNLVWLSHDTDLAPRPAGLAVLRPEREDHRSHRPGHDGIEHDRRAAALPYLVPPPRADRAPVADHGPPVPGPVRRWRRP